MPSFRPSSAAGISSLDLDKHARGDDEPVEGFDGAGVGFSDVDDALVSSNLELFARFLVDEWRAVEGVNLAPGRQRHRTGHARTGAFGVIDDLLGGGVQRLVVVSFHPNSNLAACHKTARSCLDQLKVSKIPYRRRDIRLRPSNPPVRE